MKSFFRDLQMILNRMNYKSLLKKKNQITKFVKMNKK